MKDIIKQHNSLTEAHYEMSALQKNIVYVLISTLDHKHEDMVYDIPISELRRLSGKEINHVSFREATKVLSDKKIYLHHPEQGFVKFGLILSAKYVQESSVIRIELSEASYPLLFSLKKRFTTFSLSNVLRLRSKFSKRIYEMLSQYKDQGRLYVTLSELKGRLGLVDHDTGKEKYTEFGLFRKKVLDIAKREVNQCTELKFDYEAKKTGKKYTHLVFAINTGNVQLGLPFRNLTDLSDKLVQTYKLSPWQAKRIISNVSEEQIIDTLKPIVLGNFHGRVKNLGAYTAKTFDQKYQLGLFATS